MNEIFGMGRRGIARNGVKIYRGLHSHYSRAIIIPDAARNRGYINSRPTPSENVSRVLTRGASGLANFRRLKRLLFFNVPPLARRNDLKILLSSIFYPSISLPNLVRSLASRRYAAN